MENFSIDKKGYNKSEVDVYLQKIINQYERASFEQRERIESLKNENKNLQLQNAEYQSKKDNINLALTQAIEKAKNIEYASKIRYALEGERITIFEKKWSTYCKNVMPKIAPQIVTEMNNFFNNTRQELSAMLSENLNLSTKAQILYEA